MRVSTKFFFLVEVHDEWHYINIPRKNWDMELIEIWFLIWISFNSMSHTYDVCIYYFLFTFAVAVDRKKSV